MSLTAFSRISGSPTICWWCRPDTTARIEEMHITLGQMLCGALEIELGLTA